MERKVLILAGEASGDHHGAGLVREVLAREPGVRFFGMAGPEMVRAGVEPIVDLAEVSVVGILEVARHLPGIRGAYSRLSRAMSDRRPDLFLPIDFPDFNLLLARRARRLGIPVLYFVSPQIWAWRTGRLRTIAGRVDRMMVLFRFEEELYRRAGVPVTWVGHPLAEDLPGRPGRQEARDALSLSGTDPVIALLPGSRRSEVDRILPVMLEAAGVISRKAPGCRFILPAAPTLDPGRMQALCGEGPVRVVRDRLDAALAAADAAAVASGTATLQVALAGIPMVIVYRLSPLTAWIGRRLIRIPSIGLANLVAGETVAEELVQEEFTAQRLAASLRRLLDPGTASRARRDLDRVRQGLGEPGAFRRAAEQTLEMLRDPVDAGKAKTL